MTVAIIDYGSGNLHSAQKAFERAAREAGLDCAVKVTSDPEDVLAAGHVVLPGVGAFADCRRGLDAVPGMVEALTRGGAEAGKPFLGICVGAQLLATRGLEYETTEGLGWIPGDVAPIRPTDPALKIPAHGLEHARGEARPPRSRRDPNRARRPARLFRPFLPDLRGRSRATSSPTADYGGPVTAIVARDNIVGTQFHPEKSQTLGLEPDRQFPEVAPVILFPAIDLKNGECVRLLRGDMAQATVFNSDPAAQAQSLRRAGVRVSARRRPRRGLRGPSGQRRGGRSGSSPGSP